MVLNLQEEEAWTNPWTDGQPGGRSGYDRSEKKAITLGAGPQRAAHINPNAPRLILEWDGYAWEPVTTVENYAAALRLLNPPPPAPPTTPPQPVPLRPGKGRHRKPLRSAPATKKVFLHGRQRTPPRCCTSQEGHG
ncbi:DUF6087 family protein [Streptomyces sp. NPDC059835]|uniref:DUF6087 family protein n=1 Tax=Streptomyces sp. NPDC059835 TaxID=3346967 RepID=UPI00365FC22F